MKIVLLILLVVSLAACTTPLEKQDNIVCNAPYVRFADGCCLDRNANGVCDTDEPIEEASEELEKECPEGMSLSPVEDDNGRHIRTVEGFREMMREGNLEVAEQLDVLSDEQLVAVMGVHETHDGLYMCMAEMRFLEAK